MPGAAARVQAGTVRPCRPHQHRRGTSRAVQSRGASTGAACSGRHGVAACSTVSPGSKGMSSPSSLKCDGATGRCGRSCAVHRASSRCAAVSSRPVMQAADRQLGGRGRRPARSTATAGALVGRAELRGWCRAAGCRPWRPGRNGWWRAAACPARTARRCRGASRRPGQLVHAPTTSSVPTRQGVQKPQLSCAKKSAKPRATSNMSRLRSKTMKAPAVGTSSKAMRRPNSKADRHCPMARPPAPPACRARRSLPACGRCACRRGIRRARAFAVARHGMDLGAGDSAGCRCPPTRPRRAG
jgi:hypothetical protein